MPTDGSALVTYPDSDNSDAEENSNQATSPKSGAPPKQGPFHKKVHPATPHKIRINLPTPLITTDDTDIDAPTAKKARTIGLGGFNSLLPPPKKPDRGRSSNDDSGTTVRLHVGDTGVLRTGIAPSFARDACVPESEQALERTGNEDYLLSRLNPVTGLREQESPKGGAEEQKMVGRPILFKPLSVTRQTRKRTSRHEDTVPGARSETRSAGRLAARPPGSSHLEGRVTGTTTAPACSLFSFAQEESSIIPETTANEGKTEVGSAFTAKLGTEAARVASDAAVRPEPNLSWEEQPQSLGTIASDLNLSASARRQLFGRQSGKGNLQPELPAVSIMKFNTDDEYAFNESIRASGDSAQPNPVRAIAPGKHSLKQLVNAASSQKEALEEQFASGKRNRREAGGKFGW